MDWLDRQARERAQKVFLNGLTFRQVAEQVDDMAGHLYGALGGLHRIAIWSANSLDMAMCLLALMKLQKEVLFLNVHLTAEEIIQQVQGLDVDMVIMDEDRYNKWQALVAQPAISHGKRENVLGEALSLTVSTLAALVTGPRVSYPLLPPPPDSAIAAIMNTSATTGHFKSVPLRWGQIRAHVKASQEVLGYEDGDNWLMVLPLFHVSGFSILMRSLYNGTAVTIEEKYKEDRVLQLINSGRVTMVSLVPTLLKSLIGKISPHHSLRVILLGGEYIPDQLIEEAIAHQLPVYKTYGMTETFSQCVTMSLLEHLDKKQSVGRPLPGMSLAIHKADSDGIGEIYVSGPMLMSGYLGRPPLGGSFNTEDIGYLDDDGYLYILNRRKDLIISGGENIYPKEIEDLVYSLSFVKECALVPVDDDRWGQVPALFFALEEDSVISAREAQTRIESLLHQSLAKYKWPKYFRLMEALPRNGTGKILRKDLCV